MENIKDGQIFQAFGVFTTTNRIGSKYSQVLLCVCKDEESAKVMAKESGTIGAETCVDTITLIKANDGNNYLLGKPIDIMHVSKDYLQKKAIENIIIGNCITRDLIRADRDW